MAQVQSESLLLGKFTLPLHIFIPIFGRYSTSFVYWFDIIACQMYLFHVFLLWYLTPSGNWYRNLDKPFCLVTTFIYIDMLLDVARESYGLRPFRFLRPLLYVLLSPQSRNMAKSTLATIVPVVKAVLLLLLFQVSTWWWWNIFERNRI
eukprot:c20125_g1_i3.p2 GENE.c20125_g1_i3~~c20125_g1_i3.p2  ORF type:complete len:149 (+),score=22.67 c20125_g1_i3:396-842(+)